MNQKKRIVGLIVFLFLFVLSGCGKAAFSATTVEPQKWADKIRTSAKFTDQMTELGTSAALKRYTVSQDKVDACAVYVGTGATAEELSVWKAKDAKAAETILQNAKALVTSQENTYASYSPAEVPKLKNAVVKQQDTVVVLCVSADNSKAKQVIDDLFSGR